MLAAEAKKAERVSDDKRLIPTSNLELDGGLRSTENHQGENYKWLIRPRRDGHRAFL